MKARTVICLAVVLAGPAAVPSPLAQAQDKKELLGLPGPEHKKLEALAGTFSARVKAFEPGKPPLESNGTMTRTMIFGGRYLKEEYTGQMAGQLFNGLSMIGYDKVQRKYMIVWLDSASTDVMITSGTYDDRSRSFTYVTDLYDPYKGKKTRARDVLQILSADQQKFEMFRQPPDPGAKEVRILEITYTRRR